LSVRWLPFVIAAAIVILDRLSKIYIRLHFRDFDSFQVVPGWFRIVHTENPGAAFGMLSDGSPMLRGIILIGISTVVLAFVAHSLLKNSSSAMGTLSRLGLGCILGGAVGNLYDRVLIGTVTDFLEIYNGSWSFPAFNVADSAITVGAVLLLIDLLRPSRKSVAPQVLQPPTEF
jgi:signal peptidase II